MPHDKVLRSLKWLRTHPGIFRPADVSRIAAAALELLQGPAWVDVRGPYPTTEEINVLPPRLRAYIHDLETCVDQAGDLRALRLAQDENRMLRVKIEELTGPPPSVPAEGVPPPPEGYDIPPGYVILEWEERKP